MIIVHAFGTKQKDGSLNAKTYTKWKDLLEFFKNEEIIQVGVKGDQQIAKNFQVNKSIRQVQEFLKACEFFISIDSFLPHAAHLVGKKGVVIWSQSDPNIYGYPENLNLLRDRKYLRPDQFGMWEGCPHNPDAFMSAREIYEKIIKWRGDKIVSSIPTMNSFKLHRDL